MLVIGTLVMVVVIMLAEAFLHYFPWRLILNGNELPRPVAYIFGTLAFALPLSAWLVIYGSAMVIFVVWIAITAAGATVLFLYLFDWVVSLVWKVREGDEREKNAKKS